MSKVADTRARNKAGALRMLQAREATLKVVQLNACPTCGRPVRRNNSLAGWYQCTQFGAVGFRAWPELPACTWQGFTE